MKVEQSRVDTGEKMHPPIYKCARTCKVLWLVPDDEDGLPLLQGELVFMLSGVWEQHQALLFNCKRCHQFICSLAIFKATIASPKEKS